MHYSRFASWFNENTLIFKESKYKVIDPNKLWDDTLVKHSDGISVHSIGILIKNSVTPKEYITHPLYKGDNKKGISRFKFIGVINKDKLVDSFTKNNFSLVIFKHSPKVFQKGSGEAHYLINTEPDWWPLDPFERVALKTLINNLFEITHYSELDNNYRAIK